MAKRRQVSEREREEAEENARHHRDELLAQLQAREAARRGEAPAPPATDDGAAPAGASEAEVTPPVASDDDAAPAPEPDQAEASPRASETAGPAE